MTPGRLPVWLLVPATLGVLAIVVPLAALLVRAPWSRLPTLLTSPAVRDPLLLSIGTASVATALCVVVGVPLAFVLASTRHARILRAILTVPLVLPPVVAGVALLFAFGSNGVFGGALAAMGIRLPYSTAAVVLAQTFVSMPFLVLAVEGAIANTDRSFDEVAAANGARPWFAFRHVTLPLLRPALLGGAVLAWARAIGEFGATVTFAGMFTGTTLTMPSAVYRALDADVEAAVALSVVLIVVALGTLTVMRDRWMSGVHR